MCESVEFQNLSSLANDNNYDISSLQRKMFELSSDPTLPFSSEQRGLLNYFSAQPHLTHSQLIDVLDKVKNKCESNNTNTIKHLFILPEPVVRQIKNTYNAKDHFYEWFLVFENDPVVVDTKTYTSPLDAQIQADEFMMKLENGDEKSWLRFGLMHWGNHRTLISNPHTLICQAEILHFHSYYYIIISKIIENKSNNIGDNTNNYTHNNINNYTRESTHDNTVKITNKLLAHPSLLCDCKSQLVQDASFEQTPCSSTSLGCCIDPTWVARGVLRDQLNTLSPIFYIVYSIKFNPNTNNYSAFIKELKQLLCDER